MNQQNNKKPEHCQLSTNEKTNIEWQIQKIIYSPFLNFPRSQTEPNQQKAIETSQIQPNYTNEDTNQ